MQIKTKLALGCLLSINGISYKIRHVFQKKPGSFSRLKEADNGDWPCDSYEPQFVKVLKGYSGKLYLYMSHARLQHGHKSVMHLHAEVTKFGRVSGSNRWLRVPVNFPEVPSATTAIRVKMTKRKRANQTPIAAENRTINPTPLDQTEELILELFDVKNGTSDLGKMEPTK